MAWRLAGSAADSGLAISSVWETSSVSTILSPAARSARPVSVISTTQSAMSGTLASVAP